MTANNDLYVPPGGPPQGPPLPQDIYARMGEENIFRLCEDFYAELEQTAIRDMFPEDMKAASHKLAYFLVGILGGPPLFHERIGPPMMRRRHIPFAIDESARAFWLSSMLKTLQNADTKYNFPAEHLDIFREFLKGFSGWMVNRK